jgi:predicted permease
MQALILNFSQSIFPIVLVVLSGYLLRRWRPIDPKQVAHISFIIMLPAFLFREIYRSELDLDDSFKMFGLTIILLAVLMALGWILGKAIKASVSQRAAIIITIAFMNCGALGLSVNEFTFGGDALPWAGIFFITVVVLTIPVGVYFAESGRMSPTKAIRQLFKVPIIYAVFAAFLVKAIQLEIPAVLMRPIELVAAGAVPLVLVILGIQIAEAGRPKDWKLVGLTSGVRLILSPILAYGIVQLLALQTLPLKVAVLQAGMPIAVLNGIIATEYDLEPDLVASTILVSTLLSPITLSILISTLQLI